MTELRDQTTPSERVKDVQAALVHAASREQLIDALKGKP